uniref:Ribosomal protein L5 n=1 Tax=Cavenderia fasciculata TaxID=261658 RepID=B2XX99_CACFS|nr:ribosomal protein L5 [Cavenderia fasciculata]ABX45221.1 ribosomal protein L5 [Cavenderia fasciculata]
MASYKGYQTRIVSKILLNKTGKIQKMTNKFQILSCDFCIDYIKEQKSLHDFFEILSILEQFSKQKPIIKFEKILEVGEKVKLKNVKIKVKLNKRESESFLWYFMHILMADRKKRNLVENNYMELNQSKLKFEYTNLKVFRKILLSEVHNINNFLNIQFNFNKAQTKIDKYKIYVNLKHILNK